MLKKKERLTRKEFEHSFSVGKRYHSPYMQLIHEKNSSFHGSAVVGKKVYKKAVDRNTLRRRLYGVLYRFHATTQSAGTYILIAKPKIKELSRLEIMQEARTLLQKVSK